MVSCYKWEGRTFIKEELICQHLWQPSPGSEEIIAFVWVKGATLKESKSAPCLFFVPLPLPLFVNSIRNAKGAGGNMLQANASANSLKVLLRTTQMSYGSLLNPVLTPFSPVYSVHCSLLSSKIRFRGLSRSAVAETTAPLLQIKTPRAFDQ